MMTCQVSKVMFVIICCTENVIMLALFCLESLKQPTKFRICKWRMVLWNLITAMSDEGLDFMYINSKKNILLEIILQIFTSINRIKPFQFYSKREFYFWAVWIWMTFFKAKVHYFDKWSCQIWGQGYFKYKYLSWRIFIWKILACKKLHYIINCLISSCRFIPYTLV